MSSAYRRKLSIGVQIFSDTSEGDYYYYVDKTPLIERLVKQNKYYFFGAQVTSV
ncbi:AAA family ATPase [Halomonas sp. SpR1]|uniref:AAA family ATPase n=1 Tax=Halomonas sp. SpR1 TaxID=3050462 RepID=UPI0027E56BBA|nr:AAA family ATPase [Halomonas sp. SpR1]MDQ7731679.1 AAA family ATPase [Halomonas sp. SpR1]